MCTGLLPNKTLGILILDFYSSQKKKKKKNKQTNKPEMKKKDFYCYKR